MKKATTYLAIGAGILSLMAFIITKANKKYTPFNQCCFNGVTGVTYQNSGHLTSVKGPGAKTLWLATRMPFSITILHTAVTCTNKKVQIYYK